VVALVAAFVPTAGEVALVVSAMVLFSLKKLFLFDVLPGCRDDALYKSSKNAVSPLFALLLVRFMLNQPVFGADYPLRGCFVEMRPRKAQLYVRTAPPKLPEDGQCHFAKFAPG